MGDFSTVALTLGGILIIILFFILKYKPELAIITFSLSLTILSGFGMYITTASDKTIFEVFFILALVATAVSSLGMVLDVAKLALNTMINRRGL